MRYLRIGVCVLALVVLMGCATSINKVSENYAESSAAVHGFLQVTAADWLLTSGWLAGSLPADLEGFSGARCQSSSIPSGICRQSVQALPPLGDRARTSTTTRRNQQGKMKHLLYAPNSSHRLGR